MTVTPAIQEVYYDPDRYPDREPHPRDGRHRVGYCWRISPRFVAKAFRFTDFAAKKRADERTRITDLLITSASPVRLQLFVEVDNLLEQERFGLLTYRICSRLFAWLVVKTVVTRPQ